MTTNNGRIKLLKEDVDILKAYLKASLDVQMDNHEQAAILKSVEAAEIISNEDFPNDMSRITSTIVIWDNISKTTLEFKLVHPTESNERLGKLSPLNSLGIALMGLRRGDSFVWQKAKRKKYFFVKEVRNTSYI